MKPHPRIRKTIKWGGAVVTVLLVAAWIGSGSYRRVWYFANGAVVGVAYGRVRVGVGPPVEEPIFGIIHRYEADKDHWQPFKLIWSPLHTRPFGGGPLMFYCPLWLPGLLALIPTAAAWRIDVLARRRERIGKCPKCTYDRAGIAGDAKCPECGSHPA